MVDVCQTTLTLSVDVADILASALAEKQRKTGWFMYSFFHKCSPHKLKYKVTIPDQKL